MAMATLEIPRALGSGDARPPTAADVVLMYTQYWYAGVLLLAFVGFAGAQSIILARKEEDLDKPVALGPGGKPLPVNKKKKKQGNQAEEKTLGPKFSSCPRRVFQGLSVVIVCTLVANGVVSAVHTIRSLEWPFTGGDNGWWGPEWVRVGSPVDRLVQLLR